MGQAMDSTVRCRHCRREEAVSFSYCLRKGWPKCCGGTMELVSQPTRETVTAAVKEAMAPLRAARKLARGSTE